MFDSASSFSALVRIAVDVVILFMALLSFVESAPRAYRLKVSNAAPSNFNIKRDDSVLLDHADIALAANDIDALAGRVEICVVACRLHADPRNLLARVRIEDDHEGR